MEQHQVQFNTSQVSHSPSKIAKTKAGPSQGISKKKAKKEPSVSKLLSPQTAQTAPVSRRLTPLSAGWVEMEKSKSVPTSTAPFHSYDPKRNVFSEVLTPDRKTTSKTEAPSNAADSPWSASPGYFPPFAVPQSIESSQHEDVLEKAAKVVCIQKEQNEVSLSSAGLFQLTPAAEDQQVSETINGLSHTMDKLAMPGDGMPSSAAPLVEQDGGIGGVSTAQPAADYYMDLDFAKFLKEYQADPDSFNIEH
jgi:hypothetical protein